MQPKQEKSFSLKLFDSSIKSHIDELNTLIDSEIARRECEIKPMEITHKKMVEWLRGYVNSTEQMDLYHGDDRSLEMVAEATFWSVKLGLAEEFSKMSHAELRNFRPLEEAFSHKTLRSELINSVMAKLVKPAMSHEASAALQQASWFVYIHNNSLQKLQEEDAAYDNAKAGLPSKF